MNDAATVKPQNTRTSDSERAACAGAYTLAIDIVTGLVIMDAGDGEWVFDGKRVDLRTSYAIKA